jgi:hypothetical protein
MLDDFVEEEEEDPVMDLPKLVPGEDGDRPGDFFFDQYVESLDTLSDRPSYARLADQLRDPKTQKEIKYTVSREAPFLGFTDEEFSPENVFVPQLKEVGATTYWSL